MVEEWFGGGGGSPVPAEPGVGEAGCAEVDAPIGVTSRFDDLVEQVLDLDENRAGFGGAEASAHPQVDRGGGGKLERVGVVLEGRAHMPQPQPEAPRAGGPVGPRD